MKKKSSFLLKDVSLLGKSLFLSGVLSIFCAEISAQGPYAPAAGNAGSTAVSKDSAIIKSWATGVNVQRGYIQINDTSKYYNGSNKASYGYSAQALGKAQGSSTQIVSIGDNGVATLTFDSPITNGIGADFTVFENGFADTFLELAFVEVSSDGNRFVRFPSVSLTPTITQIGGFGALDPANIHNLAGKYRQGYGTPFDLDDVKDSIGLDINNIRFVRVIDVVGSIDPLYASYDSKGNIINDPWSTPYHSGGFDLDGVGVINHGKAYQISYFDELSLPIDSFWNGKDGAGKFHSGLVQFDNSFTDWGGGMFSWAGFSYSNKRNDTLGDYTNEFSAITRGGMNATDTGGTNFALGYVGYSPIEMTFTNHAANVVNGFYITNSTYTGLTIQNGGMFAKKFGGADGNDKDWYKIIIWGEDKSGKLTDTIEYFLADYRFDNNHQDYVTKDWQWVDLAKLGKVKTVYFDASSTDIGSFGINTPTYFCMDNLSVVPDEAPLWNNHIADISVVKNAPDVVKNLAGLVTDNDDNVAEIEYSVFSNSDTNLVSAKISSNELTFSFKPDTIGAATVILQALSNGVTVNDTVLVSVIEPSSVESLAFNASSINYYPNPVVDILTVSGVLHANLLITNITGVTIAQINDCAESEQLDLSNLPNGLYLLTVENNQQSSTFKIIKK